MAQALQHDPTALISELSPAGTANIGTYTAASGSERGDAVVSIPLVQNIRQVTRRCCGRLIETPTLTGFRSAHERALSGILLINAAARYRAFD